MNRRSVRILSGALVLASLLPSCGGSGVGPTAVPTPTPATQSVTFVAYLLNTWALRHVDPGVVGTFIYLQPVLAATLGAFMGGPMPQGPWPWISAAAIFTGVHLVTRRVPTR